MAKFARQHFRTVIICLVAISIVASLTWQAWWRWKVDAALEAALTHGPNFDQHIRRRSWYSDTVSSKKSDNFAYLVGDYERVIPRLMKVAESDTSTERRINAVRTIGSLVTPTDSFDVCRQHMPKVLTLVFQDGTPLPLEAELASLVNYWVPMTGISEAERRAIRGLASSRANAGQTHWFRLLGSIGGREEVELLIQLADRNEASRKAVITESGFLYLAWKGLLPHAQTWLADPAVSPLVVNLVVLRRFPEGREALRFAMLDESQPTQTRRAAFNRLSDISASLELLEEDIREDAVANDLDVHMGFNCREHLASKRQEMHERNGKRLWEELIAGLDIDYWLPNAGDDWPKSVRDVHQKFREKSARETLVALRCLSGQADLTTKVEWQTWLQKNTSLRVEQSDLLEMVANTPELIDCTAVHRRIVLWDLGDMPENCEPIYRRWLRSSNPNLQYWACDALLKFGQSPEAVDVAIDLIERTPPEPLHWDKWAAIRLLKNCFAVNYFWDIAAWRNWAKQHRAEATEREAQE